jgi:hypothetical protein
MKPTLPFELHLQGHGGGFIIFEMTESVALPLLALRRAVLRGSAQQAVLLEFEDQIAVIDGSGLGDLFLHLLSGRLKAVRCGRLETCLIESIRLTDA